VQLVKAETLEQAIQSRGRQCWLRDAQFRRATEGVAKLYDRVGVIFYRNNDINTIMVQIMLIVH
jgi:hypothetical protein